MNHLHFSIKKQERNQNKTKQKQGEKKKKKKRETKQKRIHIFCFLLFCFETTFVWEKGPIYTFIESKFIRHFKLKDTGTQGTLV